MTELTTTSFESVDARHACWEQHVRLCRNHLSSDRVDDETLRWAWHHLTVAVKNLVELGIWDSSSLDGKIPVSLACFENDRSEIPNERTICDICETLESLRFQKKFYRIFPEKWFSKFPLLLRDLTIVGLTLFSTAILYRVYHDLPVNLWTNEISLMDIHIKSSTQSYGKLQINKTTDKVPVLISGKYYPKAVGVHALSRLEIEISKAGDFFEGGCGYPDSVSAGMVICSILMPDGSEIWNSGPLSKSRRYQNFSIELPGRSKIALTVKSAKESITQAHAVWVGLKVR